MVLRMTGNPNETSRSVTIRTQKPNGYPTLLTESTTILKTTQTYFRLSFGILTIQ